MKRQSNWVRWWLRLAALTGVLVATSPLTGCKPAVVQAFYSELENLAVSLVQAYFEAITPTTSGTTAQSLMHALQTWVV